MRLTNLITAVDLHACGEPGRVIIGGVNPLSNRRILGGSYCITSWKEKIDR